MKRKIDPKLDKNFFFNIVVPVFNAEKYIEKCLLSIINQSIKKLIKENKILHEENRNLQEVIRDLKNLLHRVEHLEQVVGKHKSS